MRPKAIKDLGQLSDQDLFVQIAEGLNHIVTNATRLAEDANLLEEAERGRGFSVLGALANEEAAKVLILLDAVRCPRNPSDNFARHLSGFNDHMVKGIYAEAVHWAMPTYGDLIEAIENAREQYYLDGPNDVDWIFRNRILAEREETIYVDYIATEHDHYWYVPRQDSFLAPSTPMSVLLARSFQSLGLCSADSLKVVADFWRQIQFDEDSHWMDQAELNKSTLLKLAENDLLLETEGREISIVVNSWQFPMYQLNLRLSASDNRNELRKLREQWSPW